jgi:hypothetical protein
MEDEAPTLQKAQADAQALFENVLPAYDAGHRAISDLRMVDLCEMRAYARPPLEVVKIMQVTHSLALSYLNRKWCCLCCLRLYCSCRNVKRTPEITKSSIYVVLV